jgi:2-dehydro-3-deoxyphosphogluconate aldolase/(4S)-4-hydroxy-2-oxoglutarate aldolase
MTGADVLAGVCARGIIPVVVLETRERALPLAQALRDGGLPIAEVTFRTPAAADGVRLLAAEGDIVVGAGTIVRAEQVDVAVEAGARFIVTPGLSRGVVERCRELSVPVIPGVATATEVIAALDLGCELLKFFPAEACGGVATLKALGGPFPSVRFVPTGGITAANAGDYLRLRSVVAVGGSWMVAPGLIAADDYAGVSRLAAEAAAMAALVRA